MFLVTCVLGCASGEDGTVETDAGDDAVVDASTETAIDSALVDSGTGTTPDATTDAAVAPAVAKLDADLAKAICAKLGSCCATAEYQAFFARFQTKPFSLEPGKFPAPGECVDTVRDQLALLHGKWLPSIERGRMTFDAAKGAACVAAIEAATCGPTLASAVEDPTCFDLRETTVFKKIAPIGSPCVDLGDTTFNGECDPELGYCDGPPSKVTDRKCVPWRKEGEECAIVPTWQFCNTRKGANCDGMTPTKPGKCSANAKTAALGESCTALSGPLIDCAAGTYCADSGKCEAKKTDGTACTYDYECATTRARSCYPATTGAAATCGSSTWCAGASDAGVSDTGIEDTFAPDTFAPDTSAPDTFVPDTSVADTTTADVAPASALSIERTDDASPTPASSVAAAVRDRVTLKWDVPGATSLALTGAGPMIALVTDGTPRWDDLTAAGGGTDRVEKTSGLTSVTTVALPATFKPTILGDVWQTSIAIGIRGVISRSSSSGTVSNPSLPMPKPFVSTDWADGTIAPFMDAKIDVSTTSKLRYASFVGSSDPRVVVEWNDVTFFPENSTTKSPAHLTFQTAIYADGRVEFRYKTLSVDASSTRPIADLALARGQGAAIGLASSSGTAIPLSVRRPSLPTSGVTYTFTPTDKLPGKGVAIAVLPATPGTVAFRLADGASTVGTANATVDPMYALTTGTGTVRDISGEAGVKTLLPPTLLELPFALGTFREGWTALTIGKGVVYPWGANGTALSNDRPIPSTYAPSAIIAAAYPLNSSSWCGGAHYALVEGAAPSRKVIVLMKGVYRCGASTSETLDVETTLFENGDVEVVYGNVVGTGAKLTGEGLVAGVENGNGDVGYEAFHAVAGSISSGKRLTFTRKP